MTKDSLIGKLRRFCRYNQEIEIFRVGMTNQYGIREVYRARKKRPDGVSGRRDYSEQEGASITMTFEQMRLLLDAADGFVRKMK